MAEHSTTPMEVLAFLPPGMRDALADTLTELENSLEIHNAVVYVHDYRANVLRCAQKIGSRIRSEQLVAWDLPYDHKSFATFVLRTKEPQFSEYPPEDDRFDQERVRIFGIHDPVLGLPIFDNKEAIGVLVVWGVNSIIQDPMLNRNIIKYFQKSLHNLKQIITEWQISLLHPINAVIKAEHIMAHTKQSLGTPEQILLRTVLRIGFDRVRLIRYDELFGTITCISHANVEISRASRPSDLVNTRWHITNVPYIEQFLEDLLVSEENYYASGFDAIDYWHEGNHRKKKNTYPLVITALWVNGSLVGFVEADNKYTKREMSDEMIEILQIVTKENKAGQMIHEQKERVEPIEGDGFNQTFDEPTPLNEDEVGLRQEPRNFEYDRIDPNTPDNGQTMLDELRKWRWIGTTFATVVTIALAGGFGCPGEGGCQSCRP